ncbi:MAG: Serine/threonine-protein kinase PknD [Acidobacteria bacterium]|nr:Serine/threonine-protein kinase PknD [Acidobacteriota bacterium]
MKDERLQRIEELFHDVAELEPEARADFLNEVCADNDGLRAEIEALLQADAEAPEFIIASAPVITSRSSAPPQAGERIGQYRLLREIGRGGMGVVWLAERDDGRFDQRVAIKVIKRGMDTDEVSRRFARERRILAQLSHPNIARLLDGGETADGRPWFALEYVEGERLDRYYENRNPGLVERLELFRQICAAVQYAHQNLVIHRDLKPGNILVTAEGAPKLLDFGIAKLLDPGDEITGLTETGQRVMTMDYASPEQVGAGMVTTASDVYSLGVILYELISGRRPYDLTNLPYHEITRVICEQEPRPPSRADASPEAAGWRDKLASDLDNIALKALSKEPERRYASAAELAEDIRRYLAGLPVGASGDTLAYRAAKFVKRNKGVVTAVVAVILALVIGLVAAMWQSAIARRERDNAQAINDFIRDILSNANPVYGAPGHGKGPDVTLLDVLRYAEKKIDEKFKYRPEIRNDLHYTLGVIWEARGEWGAAESHFRAGMELSSQIYGERHSRVIQNLYHLGLLEGRKGNGAGAVTIMRQAVEMMRLSDPQNEDFPHMLLNLSQELFWTGNSPEAESLIIEAREAFRKMLGTADHLWVAYTFCRLGNIYAGEGEQEQAQAAYNEYLERLRRLPVTYQAGEALYNLGVIDYIKGDYQEAEKRLNEAERLFSKYLGADYPQIAQFLYYLSSIHCLRKDYARAEAEARRALEINRRKHGPNDARTVIALGLLIKTLIVADRSARAEPYLREAMEKFQAVQDRKKGQWAAAAGILGECMTLLKRYDEAERLLIENFRGFEACVEKCQDKVEARQRLVKLYEAWGKPDRAARFHG